MPGTCLLASDYTFLNCKGSVGGIQKIFITEWANLTGTGSAFTASAGVITAWTLATGKKFRTYALDDEMGAATFPMKVSRDNGSMVFEPTIDFTIKTLAITTIQELINVAKNYLCIIVLDNNGVYWVFGYNRPMSIDGISFDLGKKLEDGQLQNLSFKGVDSQWVYQMTASLISVLTT